MSFFFFYLSTSLRITFINNIEHTKTTSLISDIQLLKVEVAEVLFSAFFSLFISACISLFQTQSQDESGGESAGEAALEQHYIALASMYTHARLYPIL